MSDRRPIGVFDSGLGGLTVVKEILRLMPGERIIYLGDTARVPYGGRSAETIRAFATQNADFLLEFDIKMMIVACNTVSAVGIHNLRQFTEDVPIIGMVSPVAKAAVLRTAKKKVGVIGTQATVGAESYVKALHDLDPTIQVYSRACPLFVPIVEEGLAYHDIARVTAQHYLGTMVNVGIDVLILGCTHYPLLMEVIQETVGMGVQLIDSALWAAKEAYDILSAMDALFPEKSNGLASSVFYVTDITPQFEKTAAVFLGQELPCVKKVSLEELGKSGSETPRPSIKM